MLRTSADAGLGACFFGIPVDRTTFREAFGGVEFTRRGDLDGLQRRTACDPRSRRRPRKRSYSQLGGQIPVGQRD
jgi:hypothetical protein